MWLGGLRLSQFGQYELLARIAKGGMAETWRANLKGAAGVTRSVVIKKVLPSYAQDEAFIEAFITEARLSTTLSHPNIAQVFDFGEVGGEYFLAMEFVDGRSVADMLKRATELGFRILPEQLACFLAIEVLRGLHHAHTRVGDDRKSLQIVHRDVSPDNILVSFEGQTKVIDFGVAKAVLHGRAETAPGTVKGKFQYFSPEQAGAKALDARSDVFAVGILLYRMLTGAMPFEGQAHVVMQAIAKGNFPPPLVLNNALTPELSAIVLKAMATSRDQRFSSALQMDEALQHLLHTQDPGFSGSQMLKEFMQWLFRAELEAAGPKVALSARFEKQLAQWKKTPRAQVSTVGLAPVPASRTPWIVFGTLVVALSLGALIWSHEPEPVRDGRLAMPIVEPKPAPPVPLAKPSSVVDPPPVEPAHPLPTLDEIVAGEVALIAREKKLARVLAGLVTSELAAGRNYAASELASLCVELNPRECSCYRDGALASRAMSADRVTRESMERGKADALITYATCRPNAGDARTLFALGETWKRRKDPLAWVEAQRVAKLNGEELRREGENLDVPNPLLAAERFAACVERTPVVCDCWRRLGDLQLRLRRNTEAIAAWATYLRCDPRVDAAPVLVRIAAVRASRGEPGREVPNPSTRAALSPSAAATQRKRGKEALKAQRYEDAVVALQACHVLDRTNADCLAELADAFKGWRKVDSALQALTELRDLLRRKQASVTRVEAEIEQLTLLRASAK